jgi:uncharacterized protein
LKSGYRIVDCNRHVIEPAQLWERLEAPFRNEVQAGADLFELTVAGRPVSPRVPKYLTDPGVRQAFGSDFSAAANLRDMDRQGVDMALLLPSVALYAATANHVDGELSAAICRAYNDWLAEYTKADSARLKGVALLPLQRVSEAAKELRRAVRGLGFVAGLMVPNPMLNRKPHNPAYDPLYAEANELEVPLVVTEAAGLSLPEIGQDRYDSFFALKAIAEPFETEIALASFMGHNIVERFPNVKVGFVGAGCGWLAAWLDRLAEHWGNSFGGDSPSFLPPDHLFRQQGFVACDPWEHTVSDALEEGGDGTIVWGSRYPLPESAQFFPDGTDAVLTDSLLSDEQKRKVLADNASAIFRL